MTTFIIRIELERKLEGLRMGDAEVACMFYDKDVAEKFCNYLNHINRNNACLFHIHEWPAPVIDKNHYFWKYEDLYVQWLGLKEKTHDIHQTD
jgi:hypothetical protein